MAGALAGVTVLEFTQIIAGPFCGMLLADMGADVIKFEPLEGEPWRLQAEFIPKESKPFIVNNRGKRDIAIDLRRAEARAVVADLVRQADVVLINYRPGVAERLGIDYESLRQINPRLVYCENTAFGSHGPDAQKRGYDIVVQAMSGLMTSNGKVNNGRPEQATPPFADFATGTMMAFAIAAALFARERTGAGQKIESAMLGTALLMQESFTRIDAFEGERYAEMVDRLGEQRAAGATYEALLQTRANLRPAPLGLLYYRCYRTADGYLALGCLGPEPRARLRAALAFDDPRYAPDWSGDLDELRAVTETLTRWIEALFLTKTTSDWLDELTASGIPCGPVRFTEELFDDPQVLANDMVVQMEHSLVGPIQQAAPAVKLSATPAEVRLPPPALGEHTDAILRQAGLSDAQIAHLREQGVVR